MRADRPYRMKSTAAHGCLFALATFDRCLVFATPICGVVLSTPDAGLSAQVGRVDCFLKFSWFGGSISSLALVASRMFFVDRPRCVLLLARGTRSEDHSERPLIQRSFGTLLIDQALSTSNSSTQLSSDTVCALSLGVGGNADTGLTTHVLERHTGVRLLQCVH